MRLQIIDRHSTDREFFGSREWYDTHEVSEEAKLRALSKWVTQKHRQATLEQCLAAPELPSSLRRSVERLWRNLEKAQAKGQAKGQAKRQAKRSQLAGGQPGSGKSAGRGMPANAPWPAGLSYEEKQRRWAGRLCFKCGQAGHKWPACTSGAEDQGPPKQEQLQAVQQQQQQQPEGGVALGPAPPAAADEGGSALVEQAAQLEQGALAGGLAGAGSSAMEE